MYHDAILAGPIPTFVYPPVSPLIHTRIERAETKGTILLGEMARVPLAVYSMHSALCNAHTSRSFSSLFLTATLMKPSPRPKD